MAPKFILLPDGKRLELPGDKREVGPVGTFLLALFAVAVGYCFTVLFFCL